VPAGALGPADGGRGRDSSANKISIAGPARSGQSSTTQGGGLPCIESWGTLAPGKALFDPDDTHEGRFIVERHTHQL